MSAEVMGVPLSSLKDPIIEALTTYQKASDGLELQIEEAATLNLTPTYSNSARSETPATFRGQRIGPLYVIAFKPQDGTGSEITYRRGELAIASPYPYDIKVYPRAKTNTNSEAHLTLVTHAIEDVHAQPRLYAGRFDLLGLENNHWVVKIGELGHHEGEDDTTPRTTFTVGFDADGKRFGDPHAVFSGITDAIQVCAFLAMSKELEELFPNPLAALNPQMPTVK